MDILKTISCLLEYPNQYVATHCGELVQLIEQSREISPDHRKNLVALVHEIYAGDLLDAESVYVGLFEQGRSLSLHLFEHVHGESRDRGQAMVDLMQEYERNGLVLNSRELPDYIPLFLEYLAHRPDLEAREWLANVSHILGLLGARLLERSSSYACLFESLLVIAGRSQELDARRKQVVSEEPDNTPEALDKEWEEIAVTFGAEDHACSPEAAGRDDPELVAPLVWTDQVKGGSQPPTEQTL